jgi:DNA-binding beta-propeller fold protein YncE
MQDPLSMRWILTLTAMLVLTACPGTRAREKTLPSDRTERLPAMEVHAPPATSIITGLRGPESVLYDPGQDVYFVSNINGGLLEADGNGFISRVQPGSMAVDLKWIEGGRAGVRLDAPKGMAILGETLYVSDVTAVRRFDRRTGAPRGELALPGATLINDITTDGTSLYVSDTGVRPGPGTTFVSTGTDAIWKITGDHVEKLAEGRALGQPNGVDFAGGTLRVVTFEGNELYALEGGTRTDLARLPAGQLDGLIHLADGSVIVTSWLGKQIYRGRPGGPFTAILAGIATPADIGYDTKRHLLLVPSSAAGQVTVHPLR